MAGCASPSAPSPSLPPVQAVPPPPALSADQMAKLSQQAPDTYRRVQMAQPLSLDDVKALAKIGFGPDVLIAQIRNSHTVYHLTANAIIDLKNSGVSEQVIDFMISSPGSIGGSTPVPEPQSNSAAVQTPPPAPMVETPPPTPGADYVWVDGDWVWNGGWVRGWGGFHRVPGRWRH